MSKGASFVEVKLARRSAIKEYAMTGNQKIAKHASNLPNWGTIFKMSNRPLNGLGALKFPAALSRIQAAK
jgi:hypothetical protein